MRLRIGIGMARMSILCHRSSSLASYIIYGNALGWFAKAMEFAWGTVPRQAGLITPATMRCRGRGFLFYARKSMALDELYERRLVTVVAMVGDALGRIEHLLGSLKGGAAAKQGPNPFAAAQIHEIQARLEGIRGMLSEAVRVFRLKPQKPEPRQVLAAELAELWVILENAKPQRMKGYGRELTPADNAQWERVIQGLLSEVERVRAIASGEAPPGRRGP